MRIIIEARIQDSAGGSEPIRLIEFERADADLKQVGLSLAEGKSLMYAAQRALVNAHAHAVLAASRTCSQCGAMCSIKRRTPSDTEQSSAKCQLQVHSCASASVVNTSAKSHSDLQTSRPGRLTIDTGHYLARPDAQYDQGFIKMFAVLKHYSTFFNL